ncbi:MAG: chemotaxis protein CheR [Proteobacteria bacterium]|nr:chemotaxis protein CheR [Pseudomonadota bacterium]MBU1648717.1 chemotaxis protein CheR [Pseudomonadota bacterium]MBU1986359.1 chemotaxis protein CheR [Pseudomonadota bacterium]
MGKRITDDLLAEFSSFVEIRMGLSFPKEKWADLEKGLHTAYAQFGCDNEESFVRHVMSSSISKRQIEMLASVLTVGETYFFREKKALDVFEHIVHSKAVGPRSSKDRNLRIWSAGCASGEEPYTIAMMLKMLLPDLKEWNISILATDINPLFMEKARKGTYTQWSFREVPEPIINRFFIKRAGELEILPEIKEMVTFSYLNLMEDGYPSLLNNTNAMDVIFCRNVLMYFAPETIKQVTQRFHQCLTDGGRLIVSQTEINDEYFQGFEKASHAHALIFRKATAKVENKQYRWPSAADLPEAGKTQSEETHKPPPALAAEKRSKGEICTGVEAANLYEMAEKACKQGEYGRAEELLLRLRAEISPHAEVLTLFARICANLGRLDEGLHHIEQAIRVDTMNPGRHFLHAAILQELGQKQQAMTALRKAVYLDADFALAYFSMGNIALSSGKMREAERHFNSALLLLRRHGHDDILPESEGMTAGRLIELIESMKWRKTER